MAIGDGLRRNQAGRWRSLDRILQALPLQMSGEIDIFACISFD